MSPFHRALIVALGGVVAVGWIVTVAGGSTELPRAAPIVVSSPYRFKQDQLGTRETLSHLFARHNIYGPQLVNVLRAAHGLDPRRVRPGEQFDFKYLNTDSIPIEISHRLRGADEFLVLSRDSGETWSGLREEITWTVESFRVSGVIQSSLWGSFPGAIPDSLLPERERNRLFIALADDVYGWEIDFAYDIRRDDRFTILFERLESSEGDVRFGRLLAASVETAGNEHRSYLLPGNGGAAQYYDSRGRSMRRAFLRAPVSARVSSRFSLSRVHPILRVRRAHRGTDYAANSGTPIHATADGTVISAGRDGGYGNVVKIRHANGIETRYAHMSRIARGIRSGTRVSQDQVVGYVGMTGLATAPHVHYEFIKNGRYLNPSRVDLGDGRPVPQARRTEFDTVRVQLDSILDGQRRPQLVSLR